MAWAGNGHFGPRRGSTRREYEGGFVHVDDVAWREASRDAARGKAEEEGSDCEGVTGAWHSCRRSRKRWRREVRGEFEGRGGSCHPASYSQSRLAYISVQLGSPVEGGEGELLWSHD